MTSPTFNSGTTVLETHLHDVMPAGHTHHQAAEMVDNILATVDRRGRRQNLLFGLAAVLPMLGLAAVLANSLRPTTVTDAAAGSDVASPVTPLNQPDGPIEFSSLPTIGNWWGSMIVEMLPALALIIAVLALFFFGVGRLRRMREARPISTVLRRVGGSALLLTAVLASFLLTFDVYFIPSGSMEPTVSVGDRILATPTSSADVGDVVLHERDGVPFSIIRRVIGLPGDTVEGRDGQLYVNDQIVEHPAAGQIPDFDAVLLDEGDVFLMGDNALQSTDSIWQGPYPLDSIIAEVRTVLQIG